MFALPIIDPEFQGLIPPLSQEELEQFEQNILERRKCYDPIILWEGTIIDGHNRYEICLRHGIEFQVEDIQLPSREAVKVWILENQLHRRNLPDAMRIEMALMKAGMLREKAKANQSQAGGDKKSEKSLLAQSSKPDTVPIHVRKATAVEAGVGETTLRRYEDIKEYGSPDLQQQVQSGKLKIRTAHSLLAKEIIKQLRQAGKMIRFIESAMPAEGYQASHPEIHNKLTHLATVFNELLLKLAERDDHETRKNETRTN